MAGSGRCAMGKVAQLAWWWGGVLGRLAGVVVGWGCGVAGSWARRLAAMVPWAQLPGSAPAGKWGLKVAARLAGGWGCGAKARFVS